MTSKEDNDELLKAFTALDTDGNGVLSREELLNGYKNIFPDKKLSEIEQIVDELMDNVDINNKGEINFTEFVVAAMNREKLLHSKQIEKAFKMFDEDGNGFIDLNELKTAMSGVKLRDDEWRDLIIKYDADNDGVVSQL
jgi:calcium-dependent protein kinase